jgi:hypothetical protein
MIAEVELGSYVSDSDLAERAFACFPRREGLYTMLSYFDESTQEREKLPASCVSALTGTGLQWANFSREWMGILQDPEYDVLDNKGRSEFHACDFESPEGRKGTVYENWDDDKRKQFNKALCGAIARSGVQISAASVLVAEYEEVASKIVPVVIDGGEIAHVTRTQAFGNKYVFCAYWAMIFASEEARIYHPKSAEIIYNFESGGGYQRQVETIYDIATKAEGNYFRFSDKPNFLDKGCAVPLQAADKMAYEASKHVSHARDIDPPLKYSVVIDGKTIWKTRFALEHLVLNGMDINIRHWLKGDIEAFFAEGEESRAKRIAAASK